LHDRQEKREERIGERKLEQVQKVKIKGKSYIDTQEATILSIKVGLEKDTDSFHIGCRRKFTTRTISWEFQYLRKG
jgi:hypothetical protein